MPDVTEDDVRVAVHPHADGATVHLRVVPRAPRTALVGRHGPALKLKVHAPPVDGAANDEVRRHLAGLCRVRPADVDLLRGERSRDKVVLVRGCDVDRVRAALVGDLDA